MMDTKEIKEYVEKIDVEEAIRVFKELLKKKTLYRLMDSEVDFYERVIEFLQQGKNYKEMWEEFLDLPLGYFIKLDGKEMYFGKIYDLEEKHLLKKDRVLEKIKARGEEIKDAYKRSD